MKVHEMRPTWTDCEKPIIHYTYHTLVDAHAHGAKVVFVDEEHVMII